MTVTLDLAGGHTASGATSISFAADNAVRLPDWTAVDRPGYRLDRWTSSGTDYAPGTAVTDGLTYTAVWTPVTTAHTEHRPRACMWIMDADGNRATFSLMDGDFAIHKAENRGGEITFPLHPRSTDASDNPLSASYSHWESGGPKAISPGMYCWIGDVGSDGTLTRIGDGWISTLSAREDGGVDVTVADGISILARQGTGLRRNLRLTDQTSSQTTVRASVSNDGATATADVSRSALGGLIYDGTRPVTWYGKRASQSIDGTSIVLKSTDVGEWSDEVLILSSNDRVCSVSLQIASYPAYYGISLAVRYRSGSGETATYYIKPTEQGQTLTLTYTDIDARPLGVTGPIRISAMITDKGQTDSLFSATVIIGSYTAVTVGTSSGVASASSNTITSPSLPDDMTAWLGAVHVWAYSESALLCSDAMTWLAEALGYVPDIVSGASGGAVAMYRVGGSNAQSYLTDLADVPNASTGRMLRYELHGRIPILSVWPRTLESDGASASVGYAGDGSWDALLHSHTPARTISQRPNIITLAGSVSSSGGSTPVQLTVRDPASIAARQGLAIEQTVSDSSLASITDGMVSAWSSLTSKSLDQWEGEAVIPWDARDWVGAVARIVDSRYGVDTVARIMEATYDYSACTVTLRYGNYDARYASSLSEVASCAVTARSTADGTSDYNQQTVSGYMHHTYADSDTVQVDLDGTWYGADATYIYAIPGGGHIYVAQITSHSVPSSVQYGAVAVRVGSDEWWIPAALRPDCYAGQTLTVCIQTDG